MFAGSQSSGNAGHCAISITDDLLAAGLWGGEMQCAKDSEEKSLSQLPHFPTRCLDCAIWHLPLQIKSVSSVTKKLCVQDAGTHIMFML
jgi:hypothetical protein